VDEAVLGSHEAASDAGLYVNYLSDDDDAAKVAFGPNYDRLLALKNKYDPTNLFRMNHHIRPAL
jgi:hypothetical protein